MVWLNIDNPTKKCTLHSDSNCVYLKNKEETEYKGIGELKRHGGWLEFLKETEAREFYLAKLERYRFFEHCSNQQGHFQVITEQKRDEFKRLAEIEPVNNGIEYHQQIVGSRPRKINPANLPNWALKIYYFVVAFIVNGGMIGFSIFILEKFME